MRFYNAKRTRFVDVEVGDQFPQATNVLPPVVRDVPQRERLASVRSVCESCTEYRPAELVICAKVEPRKCGCSGRGILGMIRAGCPLEKWT